MSHLGTLRDFRFEDTADDIRGATLYGRNDEKLGKVDDVIFDHASGELKYAVVDTGGWLSSKKFLVPAGRIRSRGDKEDEYIVDLSKKQIENFPPYDENSLNDDALMSPTFFSVSPIHHHEVGMMDTTPTAFSHKQEDERLTFVPDAIGADRGDIKDKAIGSTQPDARSTAGSVADRSVGEAADVARSTRARDIVNREDDRMHHTDRGSKLSPVEQTLEGDAIFNSEDIRGRMHERGNVHDADVPSYPTVGGMETQTSQGRLPNYPDAGQGQRWARFEENLRRQRPKIVGRCNVCEEFQNRHREDVA